MSGSGAQDDGDWRRTMPPEKHLGLGSYLPLLEQPPPPSSIKGSNCGSISGSKRNACEGGSQGLPIVVSGSSSSAQKKDQECSTQGATIGTDGTNTDTQSQNQVVNIDDDEGEGDGVKPKGKRQKKCTSDVWEHFTKKTEIVEVNGKKYGQVWGYCNFPRCKAKYRTECNQGTTGFRNHLKSAHNIVKGQLQLKVEKDNGKDVTMVHQEQDRIRLDCQQDGEVAIPNLADRRQAQQR